MHQRLLLSLLLPIILCSCDPDNKDIFNRSSVKMLATISPIDENITLGDTLRINLQVPDSVLTNSSTLYVQSSQRGQFYMYIRKIDTITNTVSLAPRSTYWTTQGSVSINSMFDYNLSSNSKPFGVIINFKPQEKDYIILDVATQPGDFNINSDFEARLFVNFNVANKHWNIAVPFVGGQVWLDAVESRNQNGLGVYVFRVI